MQRRTWGELGLVLALGACGDGGGGSGSGSGGTSERVDATPGGAGGAGGGGSGGVGGAGGAPAPLGPPIAAEAPCPADAAAAPPGSGHFGCWIEDRFGRPAYEYTKPLGEGAAFTRRDGPDGADDHWHQLGNDRVTASAHVDGRIRLFDGTRGSKWVSRYSEYRVEAEGGSALPTAARSLVFGTGYVQSSERTGDLASERSVYAPFGDAPALIAAHRLQNLGDAPLTVTVTETWDANMEQLLVALTYGSTPDLGDAARARFMGQFEQTATYDADASTVTVDTDLKAGVTAPPRDEPAEGDFYPGALALVLLDGPASGFAMEKATCEGADCSPRTLATRGFSTTRVGPPPFGLVPGTTAKASAGPRPAPEGAFVASLSRQITLAPRSEATVRFALLYADEARLPEPIAALRAAPPSLEETVAAWTQASARLDLPDASPTDRAMARELAWHAPYLLGAANFEELYGVHAIDQGSAYGYLQGLRGAARDSLINAVAVVPFSPRLAREQIQYVLSTTYADQTRISYGTSGFGQLQDAIVHSKPSDLDLWLMWAVVEYVQATRDFDFLDLSVSLHPPGAGAMLTVRERLARSLDWLEGPIGYGPHGLLKVGSGDWSDGISFLAPDRGVFAAEGESVFNSAFGAYVFPRVAGLLAGRDDALAARYQAAAEGLRAALADQYQGRWFIRAWDGAGAPLAADDGTDTARISLEHHVWLLVGDAPTPEQRASVMREIAARLDAGSPIGARLMYPPIDNMFLHSGWDVNGGIWAAMNGLLVWGLSRTDPQAAWDQLVANSMMRHADTYPDLWYGIWSGPDAYNAEYTDRPGETFYHVATPMTDYPVQNSNRHSAPLLDVIKLAGIESTPAGLTIDPRMPGALARFSLDTPLVSIDYRTAAEVSGRVAFQTAGELRVRLPFEAARISVNMNGTEIVGAVDAGFAVFSAPAGEAAFVVTPLE